VICDFSMDTFKKYIFRPRVFALIFMAILVSLIFWIIPRWHPMYDYLVGQFGELVSYNYLLAIILFVALGALAAMMSFFTHAPLVPFASEVWGKPLTFTFIVLGWLIGALLAYMIGYRLSGFLHRFKIFGKISEYQQRLSGRTGLLLIFLFRFAVSSEVASYTLGIIRYPFWKYMIITGIAEFPFAFVTLFGTRALVHQRPAVFFGLIIFALAGILLAMKLFSRRLKDERNS